ncbi:organic cation/carnitine transporter 7-like isoform X2 [Panicum virgatum]|uniref:Major facilitator superfamily (MFS) profile domain-containing protein n=1 Tax=Panicum virgatum TaxID=38727 RepID=A0A8T0WCG6_PANVG|nr:organic cation/carnitine transporter 7-like isoform X2 [Panicum virgatum]KAG2646302.1 hypothetical protein PVAP13_2KG500500 [Panicum virgatum]
MAGGGSGAEAYTTDEALSRLGFGRFQALLLGFLGTGWVAEAMEVMLLSFVGPSVKEEWGVSGGAEGLITSVAFAGMLLGACVGGLVSDRYGRRAGFLFTAIVSGVPGFLCAFSPNYATLLALRFIVGLGLGGNHVLPTWFLEFVPAENRGSWIAAFTCFWTLGTILEALLAWAIMPILGWRWLLAFSSAPCFILLFFSSVIPESPRYLCSREFPGLLLAALLVDRIGRKVTLGGMILLCCAFSAPLCIQLRQGLSIILLFCARTCVMGSFAVLHVYSPEIYPTSCRNTGVGFANFIGRVGSIVAPLTITALIEKHHQKEAVLVMDLALFLAGVACTLFPLETKGREIH